MGQKIGLRNIGLSKASKAYEAKYSGQTVKKAAKKVVKAIKPTPKKIVKKVIKKVKK